MTTITTRASKGSPLTNSELDTNFSNLRDDKLELVVNGVASSSTVTPAYSDSQYNITALATDVTIAAPTGTPSEGQRLLIRIKDNGTPRTLTWNSIYRALAAILPTTTVANKTIYVGLVYNSTDVKLDVMAVAEEA